MLKYFLIFCLIHFVLLIILYFCSCKKSSSCEVLYMSMEQTVVNVSRARNFLWISCRMRQVVCTTSPKQTHFFTISWLRYSCVQADERWGIFCLNKKYAHRGRWYGETFLPWSDYWKITFILDLSNRQPKSLYFIILQLIWPKVSYQGQLKLTSVLTSRTLVFDKFTQIWLQEKLSFIQVSVMSQLQLVLTLVFYWIQVL